MQRTVLLSVLAAAATVGAAGTARAQSATVECYFSPASTLAPLATAGANGSFAANGGATIAGYQPYYETTYAIDVGVWVDDAFLATTPDAASLALRYFEHANCVFAAGANQDTGDGVNEASLRLAGNRIRYYAHTTPNAPGSTAPWGQQYNWDWAQAMKGMSGIPKVNILFTTNLAADPNAAGAYNRLTWGGAANGIGQGNAIIAVDPAWFQNGMTSGILRDLAEDWWGLIAAHEAGHALGGVHLPTQYDTMCCDTPANNYPGSVMGTTPSEDFTVAQSTWDLITANDASDVDTYADPYKSTPNPVTNVTWNFDDISDFLFERAGGDVWVAPSTGSSFLARTLRHEWFCINNEACRTGDVNGDGRADLIAFTRGTTGDVYVALGTANGGFAGTGIKWHDFFAINSETPLVGDWNGDGKDDIAAFTGGTTGDVYVALSTGSSFSGTGVVWHAYFAPTGEVPLAGDWNGDGKDDIAGLTRGTTGDVFVALSSGAGFGARTKWHEFFSINSETPLAGDWNGDGKDDLATLTRGTTGDVYVTFSTGSAFNGTGIKWHDFFCINAEVPFAGDVNHDGKDDLVSFARDAGGHVYAARSNGAAFVGTNWVWTTGLCIGDDVCGLADVTGDGRADALAFGRN